MNSRKTLGSKKRKLPQRVRHWRNKPELKNENRTNGKRKRKQADQKNAGKKWKIIAEEKTNLSAFNKFRFWECCCKHNTVLYFQQTFTAFSFFCGCSQKVALLKWSPHMQLYAWKPKKTTMSSCKSFVALSLAWERENSPSVENGFLKFRALLFSATASMALKFSDGELENAICTIFFVRVEKFCRTCEIISNKKFTQYFIAKLVAKQFLGSNCIFSLKTLSKTTHPLSGHFTPKTTF